MLINLSAQMLQCTENLTFYLSTTQTAHLFTITSKAAFKMGIATKGLFTNYVYITRWSENVHILSTFIP
jgi:hypothetical protein